MKLLIVSSRFPWPPWRGNQLRTTQWLDALEDHHRLLVCPAEDRRGSHPVSGVEIRRLPRGRLAASVGVAKALMNGRPAQEGLYATAGARRRLVKIVDEWKPDLVIVQMVRCGWAADVVRRAGPGIPILFDAIDCMALHYSRAAATISPALRPIYHFEAGRCHRRETELVRGAVVTTAVSARDLRALGAGTGGMVVPVTGGTDVAGIGPEPCDPTVILSGNLGYRPTVDAASWFADRVWPKVLEAVPSAIWVLAGARPGAGIRRLGSRPGIQVHADVDDLEPFLRRARVAIAPMASGSGVPIKILEAMAAGVPVVADPWSADGLEDPSAVVVARDEATWVDSLRRLLGDPAAAREQAARGSTVWRAHYSPDRVGVRIREAVNAASSSSS